MLNTCTCFIHVYVCWGGDLRPEKKSIRSLVNGFTDGGKPLVMGAGKQTGSTSPLAQIYVLL